MQKCFKQLCIIKIPIEENEKVDRLAWLGSATNSEIEESEENVHILYQPAIIEEISVLTLEVMPTLASKIVDYLEKGTLPTDRKR